MPDTIIPSADDRTVTVTKASGFVVVSWWQDRSGDGHKGVFDYQHHKTLNEALEAYDEYLRGEYARASGMGIFAADAFGLPVRRLDAEHLMRLVAETRAAR
jgi:hypothetical protein